MESEYKSALTSEKGKSGQLVQSNERLQEKCDSLAMEKHQWFVAAQRANRSLLEENEMLQAQNKNFRSRIANYEDSATQAEPDKKVILWQAHHNLKTRLTDLGLKCNAKEAENLFLKTRLVELEAMLYENYDHEARADGFEPGSAKVETE